MKFLNQPPQFFLGTAFLFGLIYIFIIPPFQYPDEGHHYFRAYHISEGHIFGEKTVDARFGGEIPKSMVTFENDFRSLRYNYDKRTDYRSITSYHDLPLIKEQKIFTDFPNVAYYAPFPYLTQAFACVLGKSVNASPLALLYLTRFFAFFSWLLIVWWGLRLVPFHQWTFAAIALLPSSLFLHTGMIADGITNGLCFLQIAFILKLAYGKEEVTVRDFFFLMVVSLITTLNKIVYLPLLLLLFFIPARKFNSPFSKSKFIGGVILTNVIVLFLWYLFLGDMFIPYDDYHPDFRENVQLNPGVNPHAQLQFIFQNPLQFLSIAINSHIDYAAASVVHCVGKFGWEKNYLPFFIITILILNTIWISSTETNKGVYFQNKHRWGVLGIAGIIVSIFTIVIYLQWSPVGNSEIYALGGRYYFPIIPLIFLMFKNDYFKRISTPKILIFQIIIWIGLLIGIWSVLNRYYLS